MTNNPTPDRDGQLHDACDAVWNRPAVVSSPPATDRAADELAAATCSAQYHCDGDENGPRLCIRGAQHAGKAHTDEHGFHWSDTVAVYPLADGTFRTGINLRAVLRRVADEEQPSPRCTCGETA